jgi:hypothetical protein
MRYGTEGVKERYRAFDQGVTAELSNGPKFRRWVFFWIGVLVVLAVFGMMHAHS